MAKYEAVGMDEIQQINEKGRLAYDYIDVCIVNTLLDLAAKYGKKYCYPSQIKLCELLKTIHGITMCRRSLNVRLKKLVALGCIKRIRRHCRGSSGQLELHSTAYYIMNGLLKSMKKLQKVVKRYFAAFAVQHRAQYSLTTKSNIKNLAEPRWSFDPKKVTAYLRS